MNILIADDHELFSDLIQAALRAHGLAGEHLSFTNFDGALAAAMAVAPGARVAFDLILLDMKMPGMHGLSGLRRMLQVAKGKPVAIISGVLSPAEAREVMREGAAGFLPKTMKLVEMVEAIRRIAAGERYLPKFLMSEVNLETVSPRAKPLLGDLTVRERQVLGELMQGWSNKQIGENLGISDITVKSHLVSLFKKLGARNRTDAMRIAVNLNLA